MLPVRIRDAHPAGPRRSTLSAIQTLAAPATFELEVRRSRHLARADHVRSADEAMAFVGSVRDPAAHHNCWAYRIGQHYRSSDDGEPSGTAGRPILAAIDGQGLDQVVVVVTRWFGGIKLGAGGLARAYGGAAAECLRQARRRVVITTCQGLVRGRFEDAGAIHSALSQHDAVRLEDGFSPEGMAIRFEVADTAWQALCDTLADLTKGHASLERCSPDTHDTHESHE